MTIQMFSKIERNKEKKHPRFAYSGLNFKPAPSPTLDRTFQAQTLQISELSDRGNGNENTVCQCLKATSAIITARQQ